LNPVFSHHLEVRFRDCDSMGHVNNAVYLTYLEQTRFHHWRALRRSSARPEHKSRAAAGIAKEAIMDQASNGASVGADVPGVIVARVEIDYRRAAKFGDVLVGEAGPPESTSASRRSGGPASPTSTRSSISQVRSSLMRRR